MTLNFKPALFIFDCDGTLTDTEMINNQACADAIAECGFPQYDLDYCIANYVGITMSDVKRRIEDEQQTILPDTFIPRFIELVNERMDESLPQVPGAGDAVQRIGHDHAVCVASNGERNVVLKSLQMIGVFDCFGEHHVFTKSQVVRGKPFPDLFLYAAEQMKVHPRACVVVEDSVAGVMAGVAAGMHVIGITAAAHDKIKAFSMLQAAGADYVADSWSAILDYIS